MAVKAIILNSARKRGIKGPNFDNAIAKDFAGTSDEASDENYLNLTDTAPAQRRNARRQTPRQRDSRLDTNPLEL